MLMKLMTGSSIATLVLAFSYSSSASQPFWTVTAGGYLELFELAIFLTALVVVAQAIRAGRYSYFWAAGFAGIAVLFNPFVQVTVARHTFLWADAICIAMFLLSLAPMKMHLTAQRSTSWEPILDRASEAPSPLADDPKD
jgi:hypothetical protein